jgi:hypothetical protein
MQMAEVIHNHPSRLVHFVNHVQLDVLECASADHAASHCGCFLIAAS